MYKKSKQKTSLSYVHSFVSIFIFIVTNLVSVRTSVPSTSVLLHNLNSSLSNNPKSPLTSSMTNSLKRIPSTKIYENHTVPENMQWKRFMWEEVDETMDNIANGVASGARVMKKMIDDVIQTAPVLGRFKKAIQNYQQLPITTTVKYIVKPPIISSIRSKTSKLPTLNGNNHKKIIKIITPTSSHHEAFSKGSPTTNNNEFKFLDEKILRDIEKKEEAKVEGKTSVSNYPKDEIITGKLSTNENDNDGWKPIITKLSNQNEIENGFEKSKPISQLHTKITDLPIQQQQASSDESRSHSYEVTENSAEETIDHPHTYKPQKYATYKFLIPSNEDQQNHNQQISTEKTIGSSHQAYFTLQKPQTTTSSRSSLQPSSFKLRDSQQSSTSTAAKLRYQKNNTNTVASSSNSNLKSPQVDSKNPKISTDTATTEESSLQSDSNENLFVPYDIPIGSKKTQREHRNSSRKIKNLQYFPNSDNENLRPNKTSNIQRSRGTMKFGDKLLT